MKIIIEGARLLAYVGVTMAERSTAQELLIDINIEIPDASRDSIEATANYDAVLDIAREASQGERQLVETLAQDIANALKEQLTGRVRVKVSKPRAAEKQGSSSISVEVER